MVDVGKRINNLVLQHERFVKLAETGERYFKNQNDIKKNGVANIYKPDAAVENPLVNADNRISHNWHNLLVNQKVSYLLTNPVLFDLEQEELNKAIEDVLGDEFAKECKDLAIDASNSGVGWLHLWIDEENNLQYANVDSKQIIPIFSDDLKKTVKEVIRYYALTDEDGESYIRYEWWTDESVRFYKQKGGGSVAPERVGEIGEEMYHDIGVVPFIPFYNNSTHLSDLDMYKDLIDAYDKVVSGFSNDLDDVQEVVFVIKNYGGVEKTEFLDELKKKKVIKVDNDGGVDTIRAEIPYEARSAFLDKVERQIFISGMGIDPNPEKFGTASGVALKFLYSLLELKAGLMETEFRQGFSVLVRAILRYLGKDDNQPIKQIWTRNIITNDLETAQIAQQSVGIISEKTILSNHPWVENPVLEQEQLKEERAESIVMDYSGFGGDPNVTE